MYIISGDKVTVKIGKEGSKDFMKKVLKKDQVSDSLCKKFNNITYVPNKVMFYINYS